MSLSSLPDIFRQTKYQDNAPRKQGASFSLNLNPNIPQRNLSARSLSTANGRNFATLDLHKQRSISSSILKHRSTALSEEYTKNNTADRSKKLTTFKQQPKILGERSLLKGKGSAVISISNVVYETSSKYNNRMINLEEAQSLKNLTEASLKEMQIVDFTFSEVKSTAKQIQLGLREFIKQKVSDLQNFSVYFSQSLVICYSALSKLRRETNEQIRGNKKEMEKLTYQLSTCRMLLQEFSVKGQKMTNQTIKIQQPVKIQNQFVQSTGRESPHIDFEQISQIRHSSRGGTGVMSRRTRLYEMLNNDKARKSAQLEIGQQLENIEFN